MTRLFSLLLLLIAQGKVNAQVKSYPPATASSIRDSIKHSRWDAGGSLSQYSFRYMSEFFPTGVIPVADRIVVDCWYVSSRFVNTT